MAVRAPERTKRRAPLNRERVLRAAVALADKGGFESLTMRKLAKELGVEAMSLYNHVANKDDLLDGMVDLVFAEIELPSSAGDWKAVRVRANGQEALAFYNWDAEQEAYVPFALNVLTFRGELISDVTAFIIRTPPETDDREAILRLPERDASPLSLQAAFENFGVPERLD